MDEEKVRSVRQSAPKRRGVRRWASCVALLAGLTLITACGQLSFNRETGQFSVPLGGQGQGSNR